jgi:hypothetical protein
MYGMSNLRARVLTESDAEAIRSLSARDNTERNISKPSSRYLRRSSALSSAGESPAHAVVGHARRSSDFSESSVTVL